MCSVASEVAATAAEHAFEELIRPVVRLTAPEIPIPFSPDLEKLVYPNTQKIVAVARELCEIPRRSTLQVV
jgi:pyruvate/2-oxoglutarate/acetoin dehydrogenase E1 component